MTVTFSSRDIARILHSSKVIGKKIKLRSRNQMVQSLRAKSDEDLAEIALAASYLHVIADKILLEFERLKVVVAVEEKQ